MNNFLSWFGIDKTFSSKLQNISIGAGGLSYLIFLNEKMSILLNLFLKPNTSSELCNIFIDPIEGKLFSLYLSVFFLGVTSALVKFAMPKDVTKFDSATEFISAYQSSNLGEIYDHYRLFVLPNTCLWRKAFRLRQRKKFRAISSFIEDNARLKNLSKFEKEKISTEYYRSYYYWRFESLFAAPLAKICLYCSAGIFACQAGKTFIAVLCVKICN